MKYCNKCGMKLTDDSVYCISCGNKLDEEYNAIEEKENTLSVITKVFMIEAIISYIVIASLFLWIFEYNFTLALYFTILLSIPIIVTIVMTVLYFIMIKKHKRPSLIFKILCLIFVSVLVGILMLINQDEFKN